MKKEYLTPEIELFQLNLSVGIMSNPGDDPGDPGYTGFGPARRSGLQDGPAGL